MRKISIFFTAIIALGAVVAWSGTLKADVVITSFETFFENQLYASWAAPYPDAIIDSGPESYSVTAIGYGSNWTYIGDLGVLGAGNTHLKLDITLEGPPEADGHLGPIITLVDADGSNYNFAWYGQLLGNNVLTIPVTSPTWIGAPGTTPGLDLDALEHLHLQLDPGGFGNTGQYTAIWNELSLITVTGIPGDFDEDGDVDGRDFLFWQRDPNIGSLEVWQNNYGHGTLSTLGSIPEPSSMGLLILAYIGAIGLHRPHKLMA